MGNMNVKRQGKEIELEWTDDEVRPGDQYVYLDQEDFENILKSAEKMGWFGEGFILKVFKYGDQTCVLCGENLQEGIAGFGYDIPTALYDFANNLKQSLIELEGFLFVMKGIGDGATIWDINAANILRRMQQKHSDWITIIDDIKELERIEGKEFDGAERMPYFGAVLTAKGKAILKQAEEKNEADILTKIIQEG